MVSIVQSALFAAFFLVIASSILITSLFKIKTIIPYLICIYLLSFANIVLAGELAGLFGLLDNRFFFLLIHVLILAVSFILWKKKDSPELFLAITSLWKSRKSFHPWKLIKSHPVLVLLGLGVFAAYLLAAVLVMKIPPNNYDSMTCNMTRVGYWLQNGSFLPWSTWFTQQVDYPINAQLQVLWSILFWRTDTFAGFTAWFGAVISILAVYGIARCLHFNRGQAVFAGFAYALFPQILLQSTTTMPHLVGASLVICAFYFLFLGFSDRSRRWLVISGLAIGLAASVHIIVLFTIPGFACSVLYLSIKNRKVFSKALPFIVTSAILSFIIFSSYIYIQNMITSKSPFGGSVESNPWIPDDDIQTNKEESYWNLKNVSKYTFFNLNKYIFASYDLTGFPEIIAEPFYKLRDAVFIPWFEATNIPKVSGEFDIHARNNFVSENSSWFGLVAYILFYPIIIIGTIVAIKRKEPFRGIIIANILLYALIWSAVIARDQYWSMYSGRYFIPITVLFAPLMGMIYKKGIWLKLACWIIVIASLVIAFGTMLNNYAKPLISQGAIFKWTRLQKIANVGWDQYPVMLAVEENVPPKGTLGLALTKQLMEYPYFGEYFQRTLIPIYPYDKMDDAQWLKAQNIDWILSCVETEIPVDFTEVTSVEFNPPYSLSSECRLLKRN